MSGRMKVLIGLLVFAILLFLANEIIPQLQQDKRDRQEAENRMNAISEAISLLIDAGNIDVVNAFHKGEISAEELRWKAAHSWGCVKGYGKYEKKIFIKEGRVIFRLTYDADDELSTFIVQLWDMEECTNEDIVWEFESYEIHSPMYKGIYVDESKLYLLGVPVAHGNWEIKWWTE